MGLRYTAVDQVMYPHLRIVRGLMPPDPIVVRRGTDNVLHAIPVDVQLVQLRAVLTQISRMKNPVLFLSIRGALPPPLRDHHVGPTISIHVEETQPVGIPARSGFPTPDDMPGPHTVSFSQRRLHPDHLFPDPVVADDIRPPVSIHV